MERTLVIIKPDAVQRQLIGAVLSRFEQRGLRVVALKMMSITEELARRHYAAHENKPFFPSLLRYITSSPVVVAVLEGPQAIALVRATMGATRPEEAAPGTIRGDYALSTQMNLVHGSDSAESASREIEIFFSPDELLDYDRAIDGWIIAEDE